MQDIFTDMTLATTLKEEVWVNLAPPLLVCCKTELRIAWPPQTIIPEAYCMDSQNAPNFDSKKA
jgi:hypothetical protein